MNKQQYQETLKKMKPPKYFSAITFKEAFNEGFESAKNEALFTSCLLNEQELINTLNKHPKINLDKIKDTGFYVVKKNNNTPSHYQGTTQPIDLINAQDLNFNLGNVVKYVCRAGKKEGENTLSDLEKAKDYLNFEIERVKQWTNVNAKN